jgi:ABC-type multidrug transport system ATPase subunit
MTVQAAIEARAVTYRTRAGGITVRDVSLTVGQGELVALVGGSGSGKATLLEALSGLLPPTSGTISRHPGGQIGYVPAGDSLHPVLPLGDALRYAAALRGVQDFRGEDHAGATGDALSLVGLTAEAGVPVGALNPGGRKRAEIAAELLAGPAALFLDEPTAALDPAQATQVLRLLRGLASAGSTVLLTTTSSLEAARCDKVALLAAGGHLAFFGTPADARSYFGADSLEEIYERLAGIGDPVAAWSRRFLYISRTAAGSALVPTTPRAPGPALLIPDQAGPHSAGRPTQLLADDLNRGNWRTPDSGDERDLDHEYQRELDSQFQRAAGQEHVRTLDEPQPAATGLGIPEQRQPARSAVPLRPARQLPVLIRRNAAVLARARRQQAILAAAPLIVILVLCGLLGAGALNGPAPVTLAWALVGGVVTGLAYELPARAAESGVLRRERFTGVSVPAFLAAKAMVLLPVLAVADLLVLVVPGIANRLQAGFGISYLAVFAASAVGLAAALAALLPGQRAAWLPSLHTRRP